MKSCIQCCCQIPPGILPAGLLYSDGIQEDVRNLKAIRGIWKIVRGFGLLMRREGKGLLGGWKELLQFGKLNQLKAMLCLLHLCRIEVRFTFGFSYSHFSLFNLLFYHSFYYFLIDSTLNSICRKRRFYKAFFRIQLI